ncbi:AAA ATPase domain-domain-containing protein, partial [Catenaria anguillulae PL171]
LIGLDSQQDQLVTLLDRTIHHHESNSVLLLGPHASGKSALLASCLAQVDASHSLYRLVTLHGLVHTDEKLAFRSLAHQLTVTDDQFDAQKFASNADALSYLIRTLRSGNDTWTPLVIVLDAFDEFTLHPKQTLLYTLLDSVQGQMNPMAVVGVSTRLDVVSNLEKRVRSRFSHRTLVFPALARDQFREVVRALVDGNPVVDEQGFEDEIVDTVHELTANVADMCAVLLPAVLALADDQEDGGDDEDHSEDRHLPALHLPTIRASLQSWLHLTAPSSLHLTYLHLAMLSTMCALADRGFAVSSTSSGPGAAGHSVTFAILFDAYSTFAKKHQTHGSPSGVVLIKKPVAYRAVSELIEGGWLTIVGGAGEGMLREFVQVELGVSLALVKAVVANHEASVPALGRWV